MGKLKSGVIAAVAAASIGGAFALGMFVSSAPVVVPVSQTLSGTTVAATASLNASAKSNEDPAHEKQESAAQEAAENNGTARHCHHGDNSTTGSATNTSARA